MQKEEADHLLHRASWRFAKTMPKNPHWYTLRKNWKDTDFINVVNFIRQNGKRKRWFNSVYTYYCDDSYKYWTMGNPINITKLINRVKIKEI